MKHKLSTGLSEIFCITASAPSSRTVRSWLRLLVLTLSLQSASSIGQVEWFTNLRPADKTGNQFQSHIGTKPNSVGSDTVLKVKRKSTIFWWLHNQGNRLNPRFRPSYIKGIARFEHPVDEVYQLVHSRRNDGFWRHAVGLQTLRHVLNQRVMTHGHHARHVKRFAQVRVPLLICPGK